MFFYFVKNQTLLTRQKGNKVYSIAHLLDVCNNRAQTKVFLIFISNQHNMIV